MKKLSVILPVFNQEKYLEETLNSLVEQKKWDWQESEIILIDDGSDDKSVEIAKSFQKKLPIKIIKHKKNLGLAKSLNEGLRLTNGKFVARMDGDDLAMSWRFWRQVDFLEKHTDIDLLGGFIQSFNDNGWRGQVDILPRSDREIKRTMLFYCALMHPTVMWRASWQKKVNFSYVEDVEWQGAEDYITWIKYIDKTKMANLAEVLIRYRCHSEQISYQLAEKQQRLTKKIKWIAREKWMKDLIEEFREKLKKYFRRS